MTTRLGPGPLAAGLVAVIMWGLAPVATRAAVAHLAPLPLLVLRLTVASVVMLPWAVPLFRRLRPRSAGRLVAAGILGLVGYNLPVTIGLRWLPASTAGLLLATEPVWVIRRRGFPRRAGEAGHDRGRAADPGRRERRLIEPGRCSVASWP